ncbi:MAG: HEPN domain-containing protein [Acidobacteria bacterium]|nr:HEPN domain-containing protein [Acidobacteriota bacterium]
MVEAKQELVCAWLIKSQHDLDTAHQIAGLPGGHLDAAIYHCQQAAEKALKGFLAFQDHRLERTHDIERLVTLACSYESAFADWVDAGITLTPYATAYRYPGEPGMLEPSRAEFDDALRASEGIIRCVLSKLPPELELP